MTLEPQKIAGAGGAAVVRDSQRVAAEVDYNILFRGFVGLNLDEEVGMRRSGCSQNPSPSHKIMKTEENLSRGAIFPQPVRLGLPE